MGEPLRPRRGDGPTALTAELAERMRRLLEEVQKDYPDVPTGPDDGWWLPAHLGGSAPTPAGRPRARAGAAADAGRRPGRPVGGPDAGRGERSFLARQRDRLRRRSG